MEKITSIRGFKDILPEESGIWQFVEKKARDTFEDFGFKEIRVPILEKADLFKRGIGEATDIVEKEMYSFLDKGDDYLTLRPEATASVIRAYIEHAMHTLDPVAKLYTIGPMFRRERPQKGRYRQFHQINAEVLGLDDPRLDAEVIIMLVHFLNVMELDHVKLHINSLGCRDCRPQFRNELAGFLQDKEDALCEDCRRRIHTNPLRVFDCKVESCRSLIRNAPSMNAFRCPACRDHFEELQECLNTFKVPFEVNDKMVRGLDYYTRTTFEVVTEALGAQNAVAGGGRYDSLVKDLGGPDMPGIGFAIGMERLISLLPGAKESFNIPPDLFIAAIGIEAQKISFGLCNRLRLKGIKAERSYSAASLKSQMKRADKLKCRFTLMLGEKELADRQVALRNMQTGEQTMLDLEDIDLNIINAIK
jgi:histidyl-tRNA synthetase